MTLHELIAYYEPLLQQFEERNSAALKEAQATKDNWVYTKAKLDAFREALAQEEQSLPSATIEGEVLPLVSNGPQDTDRAGDPDAGGASELPTITPEPEGGSA